MPHPINKMEGGKGRKGGRAGMQIAADATLEQRNSSIIRNLQLRDNTSTELKTMLYGHLILI